VECKPGAAARDRLRCGSELEADSEAESEDYPESVSKRYVFYMLQQNQRFAMGKRG